MSVVAKMSLEEVAMATVVIFQTANEAAEQDAGFDAGEFSTPWHDDRAYQQVEALAKCHGFTVDQVIMALNALVQEQFQDGRT